MEDTEAFYISSPFVVVAHHSYNDLNSTLLRTPTLQLRTFDRSNEGKLSPNPKTAPDYINFVTSSLSQVLQTYFKSSREGLKPIFAHLSADKMVLRKRDQDVVAGPAEERVMAAQVCGLIDTCLEEGHYESAIDILDKSRTSTIYPAPYHIRILLHLSLYPTGISYQPSLNHTASAVPPSPSKKERQRRNLIPTQAASEKAAALLQSLALTNSPKFLTQGLPAYGKRFLDNVWHFDPVPPGFAPPPSSDVRERGPTDDTNVIAREATRIAEARDVWSFLAQGFVRKMDGGEMFDPEADILALRNQKTDATALYSTPQKGKASSFRRQTKAKNAVKEEEEEWGEEDEPMDSFNSQPVGNNAWAALEWLVLVYERDQQEHKDPAANSDYSPLLLQQLPVTSPRKDISTPLKIAIFCFAGGVGPRFTLGLRLLNLIINLTTASPPNHLSPSECVRQMNAALVRHTLYDPDIKLPFDTLQSVLAGIRNPNFRLCLCCLYLATRSIDGDPSKYLGGNPSAESNRTGLNPLKSRRGKRTSAAPSTASNGSGVDASTPSTTTSTSKAYVPFPLPPLDDVLPVLALAPKLDFEDDLEVPLNINDADLEARLLVDYANAKLYVLASIGKLALHVHEDNWRDAIKDGRMRQAVEAGFRAAREAADDPFDETSAEGEEDTGQRLKGIEDAAGVYLDLWKASVA
ncbi:hypothetical protein FS837_008303 [Tulasnella sp. UAMH 9824]|nr:hypothetical protein FS837_008303 [Tulasnella sp. UAMH 9824]